MGSTSSGQEWESDSRKTKIKTQQNNNKKTHQFGKDVNHYVEDEKKRETSLINAIDQNSFIPEMFTEHLLCLRH